MDNLFANRVPHLNWKNVREMFSIWSDEFYNKPSYLEIEGRPVWSVSSLTNFAFYYGLNTFNKILLYAKGYL